MAPAGGDRGDPVAVTGVASPTVRRLGQAEQARGAGGARGQADWLDRRSAPRTGVWRIEADGEHGRVSAHTAMMYGLAPEEGYPLEEIFRRVRRRPRTRTGRVHARAGHRGLPVEHRIVLPDGGVRWVTARGGWRAEKARGAAFHRHRGRHADRHGANQLARAEAQFRAVQAQSVAFWVFDEESLRFLAVNDAAVAACGCSVGGSVDDDPRHPSQGRGPAGRRAVRRAHPAGPTASGPPAPRRQPLQGARVQQRHQFNDRPARLVLAEDISDRVAATRAGLAAPARYWPATVAMTADALSIDDRHAAMRSPSCACARWATGTDPGPARERHAAARVAVRVEALGREYGMAGYWRDSRSWWWRSSRRACRR